MIWINIDFFSKVLFLNICLGKIIVSLMVNLFVSIREQNDPDVNNCLHSIIPIFGSGHIKIMTDLFGYYYF